MSNLDKSLFTSESVTVGHPDKICDQISDAILDAYLAGDPLSRVACEVAVNTGLVLVFGEITSSHTVDIASVVKKTINDIGYNNCQSGFDAATCAVLISVDQQSPDIAQGVNEALEKREGENTGNDEFESIGAGDQGLMFGFACDETPEFMPLPISLAHRLARRLHEVRENGTMPYLLPDGKTQVTVEYQGNRPVRIDSIVCSNQHTADTTLETIRRDILTHVINEIVPKSMLDDETKYFINPTGRFVTGGPVGDAGLTGRKIIVDTYGGYSRHGGGAFSGKDPTKVDRSGSYAARYVAKNLVAAGLAKKCEVQISYAIGVSQPLSIRVDTFDTGKLNEADLVELVKLNFDLRPAAIIDHFGLRRPIYSQTAAYGHFGRNDLDLPWEKTDKIEALKVGANNTEFR